MRCPDGALLAAWVDDELDERSARTLGAHLAGCAACSELVRSDRQVKRVTAGLSVRPAPAPDDELVRSLLQLPAAEQRRQRADRCAVGVGPTPRSTGVAVGVGVGAALVAVAWLVPAGASTQPPPGGGSSPTLPATAPQSAPPVGTLTATVSPVTLARWSRGRD